MTNNSKYGISFLNQNNNSYNNNYGGDNNFQTNFRAVRVTSIVLDETHPRFKELGEWSALGTIEYEDVLIPKVTTNIAKPLMINNKNYPLINEIVYILSLPNNDMDKLTSRVNNYYINIISLWNHPHHNAYPSNPNILPSTQQQDYIQTELGSVRIITNQPYEINLGKTFVEKSNIHPILPFEGDIITEGRWGNSIRLGSTVKKTPNNWSSIGSNGDPIIIIRNGQGNQTDEGWVPTVENINNDDSSIYLTSTQKIPLKIPNISYNSYPTNPPVNPEQYSGKQIILNSGRLVFNSYDDHLLLNSNKSINLNSNNLNIDSLNTIVQSESILLGSKEATEPLLKGNLLIKEINNLIDQLIKLNIGLTNVPQVSTIATSINTELVKIKNSLELTKSKISKTI